MTTLRKRCACKEWRCEHSWFADFRVRGRRYRIPLKTSNKNLADQLLTVERTALLKARYGIFQQPDISFTDFTATYLRDHVDVNTRPETAAREREIVKTLRRVFGPVFLHEITTHRIEQFKRDRLAGRWRAPPGVGGEAGQARDGESRTRHVAGHFREGRRVAEPAGRSCDRQAEGR